MTAHTASPASPRKNDLRNDPRSELPRPPVRETLPSLSSIFGPPENIRPLHPSPLERPRGDSLTPTGPPMTLPMDQRHSPSFSYFPKVATPPASSSTLSSQALPHPPRSVYQDDHSPRQEPSRQWSDRPAPAYSSARSERSSYSEKPYYADAKYDKYASSDARGPAPPDYRRHEPAYHREHRDPRDQYSPPMGRSHSPVRGPPAAMPPAPMAMASVPASAYPEGATIPKEGMGPKIWTGVDFLPQFIRAADVPGEGLCFFYDDGSHCKATIDGENVNPYWGVTKAGKPRKRLAIACMTCREKKIKCDPEFPRCVQCEKFGRVCRFKNAPRGGNNVSPGTTPSEPSIVTPKMESPPRGMRRPSSPDRESAYKRARTDYEHYTTSSVNRSPPYGNVSPTADAPRASGAMPPAPWGYERYGRDMPYGHSQPPHSQPPPQYNQRHYDDYRRSRPSSPQDPSRTLPPPRSGPELPRIHDSMGRPWQQEVRHHRA